MPLSRQTNMSDDVSVDFHPWSLSPDTRKKCGRTEEVFEALNPTLTSVKHTDLDRNFAVYRRCTTSVI